MTNEIESRNKISIKSFLVRLDPKIIELRMLKHDMAREKFRVNKILTSSYIEFYQCIIFYYISHYAYVNDENYDEKYRKIRSNKYLFEKTFSDAKDIVNRAFYDSGGIEYAQYICNENDGGWKGGMIGVINSMTNIMKKDAKQAYIETVLSEIPPELEFRVELARQFLSKYGSFIGKNITPAKIYKVAFQLDRFLYSYAQKIGAVREEIETKCS